MPWLLVFCEAGADFDMVAILTDRVLRERGPDWVREYPAEGFDDIRGWVDYRPKRFIAWREVADVVRRLRIKPVHGHFQGKPGMADALAGRTALQIARVLGRDRQIDGVLLVRDADGQPERRRGLDQAREEALGIDPQRRVVIGVADRCREAWVIAGFAPGDSSEELRLAEMTRELTFDPRRRPHDLRDPDERGQRNPKRVLDALVAGDRSRERDCLLEPPLELLSREGAGAGLASFLDEVEQQILPLFGRQGEPS